MRDSESSRAGFGAHANEYACSDWFSRTIRVRSPLWHVYDWRILTGVFWAKNSPNARFAFQTTPTIFTSCQRSMCCGRSTNFSSVRRPLPRFCNLLERKRHTTKLPYSRQTGSNSFTSELHAHDQQTPCDISLPILRLTSATPSQGVSLR